MKEERERLKGFKVYTLVGCFQMISSDDGSEGVKESEETGFHFYCYE